MFSSYFKLQDGMKLFYKVYGSKLKNEVNSQQPTLIFLHGGPGVVDHTLYEKFWSRFSHKETIAPQFQVIFIDHRGCGRSYIDNRNYGSPQTWNLTQWGKDVYSLLTGLNLQKPVLAGVSFGGVVAMSCATQFPSSLSGLILSDTDAKFNLDEVIKAFERQVKRSGKSSHEAILVCETAKKMFLETTSNNYNKYIEICIPYCSATPYTYNDINRCIKNEASAFHYNRYELHSFDFLPRLHKIRCPTLIIAGDQSPVHTEASARRTAEKIPSNLSTIVIFDNTGSPAYKNNEVRATSLIKDLLVKSLEHINQPNQ